MPARRWRGVPKAFTAQLTVPSWPCAWAGAQPLDPQRLNRLMVELDGIPEKVEALLAKSRHPRHRRSVQRREQCLFLGRGYNLPVALEVPEIKEISYIHAEGYPVEMKHGPRYDR